MKQKIFRIIRTSILVAMIIPMIGISCNEQEILEETPLDFLAPKNAYSSVAGARQGISGLHAYARQFLFRDGASQEYFAWRRGVSTDIAYHGEDPASTKFPCDFVSFFTSTNNVSRDSWTRNYKLIQNANVLIAAIEASDPEMWENENQQDAYKAEAMFFRAYAYRELVSVFGPVPIVNEVINAPKTDFVRAPVADVYAAMESDLKFGTTHLPVRGEEEDPGRITQGAAWHFLAEAYLSEGKNQEAVDAASHVINDYGYAIMTERFGSTVDVFGTGDVYLDIHAYGNQNLPENTEAIWVVQFEPLIEGGSDFLGERGFGCAYYRMGNTPDGEKAFLGEFYNGKYTGYSDTLGRPVAWIRPTWYSENMIWQSDWDNDYRNAKHMIKRDFYWDNPASAYYKQKVDFSLYPASAGRDPIKDTCQYIFPYFMKFADPLNHFTNPDRSGGGYNHKDNYALRLAETYLLRAEAYVNLGENDKAADDINVIRERSNATPISPAEATIDFVLDERVRELWGEEQRQITLRRTGKLVERIREYCNNPKFPGLNVQDYHVLLPIPQSQIDLNIDADFPQNEGY
jgi:starch-binding outer membrane protein, SusD/RagB family